MPPSADLFLPKGKRNYSWADLPPEIITLIATYYIADPSAFFIDDPAQGDVGPRAWNGPTDWPQRMVFHVLRDNAALHRLMAISDAWHAALEKLPFWKYACSVLDMRDYLAQLSYVVPTKMPSANPHNSSSAAAIPARPTRTSPYRHFNTILRNSCVVCRVNYPHTAIGLASNNMKRKPVWTHFFARMQVCRDHDALQFCGICLRAAPPRQMQAQSQWDLGHSIYANEDQERWPRPEATCSACRCEGLLLAALPHPITHAAIGGLDGHAEDWELRQAVDMFVEMGEGTIEDVLNLALDKYWLKKQTKFQEVLDMIVAMKLVEDGTGDAPRSERPRARYRMENGDDFEEWEEEEEEEVLLSEEDEEELQANDSVAKENALRDWCRIRILDGHWIVPDDQWHMYTTPGFPRYAVEAHHPCPWILSPSAASEASSHSLSSDISSALASQQHPSPALLAAPIPPSNQLVMAAERLFRIELRAILLPPMTNIVRKHVLECTASGLDPSDRVGKMSMDDVLRELRDEEGVWYNGVDWLERLRTRRAAAASAQSSRRRQRTAGSDGDEEDAEDSGGSRTTSPVLSESTLQTTPSPPPLSDFAKLPIEIAPVAETPQLLHSIPYVPITSRHLPPKSYGILEMIWREASDPLYRCGCSICQRAIDKANAEAGAAESNTLLNTDFPMEDLARLQAGDPVLASQIVAAAEAQVRLQQQRQELDQQRQELVHEQRAQQQQEKKPTVQLQPAAEIMPSPKKGKAARGETPSPMRTPRRTPTPKEELLPAFVPRKRRSEEFEERKEDGGGGQGVPAKKARTGDAESDVSAYSLPSTPKTPKKALVPALPLTPPGIARSRSPRKRSSEELEDDMPSFGPGAGQQPQGTRERTYSSTGANKRVKLEDADDVASAGTPLSAGSVPPHSEGESDAAKGHESGTPVLTESPVLTSALPEEPSLRVVA